MNSQGTKQREEKRSEEKRREEKRREEEVGMCSIFDALPRFQQSDLTTSSEDLTGWCTAFAYIARLVAYFAVLALIVLIMLVILKYLAERDDDQSPVERFRHFRSPPLTPTETTPLRPEKAAPTTTYRSCEEGEGGDDDIESGSSSSSEELYDGKICVICYDEERNCFFVPCGHCATCYCCAQRILEGDSKNCPVCRRLVRRVRKWFTS